MLHPILTLLKWIFFWRAFNPTREKPVSAMTSQEVDRFVEETLRGTGL